MDFEQNVEIISCIKRPNNVAWIIKKDNSYFEAVTFKNHPAFEFDFKQNYIYKCTLHLGKKRMWHNGAYLMKNGKEIWVDSLILTEIKEIIEINNNEQIQYGDETIW